MNRSRIALPPLPAGETLVWRGSPDWRALALRAFHIKDVTFYFCALLVVHAVSSWWGGAAPEQVVKSGAWLLIPMTNALALLAFLAWVFSRTAHYTITSRRVLMQVGVALPMTLNIPFRLIVAASLKTYRDGTGDIPLALGPDERASYVLLWPHVRPWRFCPD